MAGIAVRWCHVLVAVLAFAVAAGPSQAQSRDDAWQRCNGADPDTAIAACGAVLASGNRLPAELAVAYDRRGIAYVRKGDYENAIADYNAAIERNPRYAEAYNDRGVAYFRKADYDRAIADTTQAIALKPDFADAFANRAEAYAQKHDDDRAIADFSRAIELNPRDAESLDHRGHAFVRTAQYDRAIADYSAAAQLDPRYAEAFNDRGVAYVDKKQYRRAIADFSAAIRLDASYTQALINRGHTYVDVGDYDDALADYSAVIRLDPGNAAVFNSRGVAYNRSGDHDQAIADYSEAIRLRPDYAVAFADRGNAYSQNHDYARAIADYDEAIRLDPFYADAVAGRGFVYLQTGQTDRAAGDLNAALRLDPALTGARFGLSVIAFAKGDYAAAVGETDAILRAAPGGMTIRYARGLYEMFAGEYQASVTDFAVANWYTINGNAVPRVLSLTLVAAILGLVAVRRRRSYRPATIRSLIRHVADVMRLAHLRSKHLALDATVPFIISVGAALGAVPLDRLWDALWLRIGMPTVLVPASGSTIVLGLCLQAFAVSAHRIAGEAPAEAGFWSAYGRFTVYAVTLFATGYVGLIVAAYILRFYSQALLQYHLLHIPVFWLAFSLIALVGFFALGLIARCSLLLPAAALGHPLSLGGAWRLQRGSTSQLSVVASLCAVLGAGLNALAGQVLAHIPSSILAPRLHDAAAAVAAQFSLYFATALVAVTLSLFYRERMAARHVETTVPGAEVSAGPLADEI